MTQLALAVDADDELWTLDDLPTPEAPYVEVGTELIEVRSRFPSQTYTLTGQELPPRIRVRRGIAGTTKASHVQGSTLTPNYGLGSGAGAGGVTVDNQSDDPELIDTLRIGATFGPEGTATVDSISVVDSGTSAEGSVSVAAQEDGTAQASIDASAQLEAAGTVYVLAFATEGAALVQNAATSASGTATARLDATSGTGDSEARLAVLNDDATPVLLAGVVARHVEGVGDALEIIGGDGMGTVGGDFDPGPGDVLTYDATVGAKWTAFDPLTSDGTIVISAAAEANVLTLGADGSFEVNGSGVVRLLGLPSADPEVAGQLYTNGVPSGGVPQALMVSGGPA